jgi:mono/diheme cytochrome c family protein
MKSPKVVAAIAGTLLVIVAAALWVLRGPGPMAFAGGKKVALVDYKGGNPTGVPTSLSNASLVDRGAYLARAADCMVCHTVPGGKPFAGGLGINLPFGTLYSTNITPDAETGIGRYSDEDFLNALHRGIRRDGARLYPAMPFTSYTYISDPDALAIKAYLFSLAPVRAAAPANTLVFPFNQRWAMGFWSAMFSRDTRFEPDASQSPEWNRGAYLAEALAHCGECHTPRNLAFALDNRDKFAGAVTAGWHAFNITADRATGVGAWSDQDLAAYLSVGHAEGHGTASGPMGEVIDQSTSQFAPEDIRALVVYLRSVPAIISTDLPSTLAPAASPSPKHGDLAADAGGKRIFEGACVSCHGWTGKSAISPFATLTGAWAVNDPAGTNVAQIVISGTRRHSPADAVSMPAFGDAYSDIEIAEVANYVTARFGSERSRLTAKDVAELRRQTAR